MNTTDLEAVLLKNGATKGQGEEEDSKLLAA